MTLLSPNSRLGVVLCVVAALATAARAEDADKAAEVFESLYGADVNRIERTADVRDDAELAARLLAAAKDLGNETALLTILCEKAYALAIRWPAGYPTAMDAATLLAAKVPDRTPDCQAMQLKVLKLQYEESKDAAAKIASGKVYLNMLLTVAENHFAAGNADKAEELYSMASAIARYLRSPQSGEIMARFRQITVEAAAIRKAQARLKVLQDKLRANPADADARRELVLLYVVDFDKPAEAVGLLTDNLDLSLRKYVQGAAKPVETAPELACLELAGWYQRLAAEASVAGRVAALRRAGGYYRRYLVLHTTGDAGGQEARTALAAIEEELAKHDVRRSGMPAALMEGLVLYYDFDKDQGATVEDKSGQGNHGTVHGAKWVKDARGPRNGAYEFDGEEAYIDAGNPASLQIVAGQTIAMWIRPTLLNARRNPFNKSFGGEGTLSLETNGTVNYWYGTAGKDADPYTRLLMTKALQAKEWTHLVIVRDVKNGRLRWFKNGRQTNEGPAKYPEARPSPNPVYLGKGYVNNFLGLMDDVMIWNRALSEDEVNRLYDFTCDKSASDLGQVVETLGRLSRKGAIEVTFHWSCSDDADVYLNGKPLRDYRPDFRTRPDEARSTFSAPAVVCSGDVITVGARRGGAYGFLLVAVDRNNRVVWKTDAKGWRVYFPADTEQWWRPEVARNSKTELVTVNPDPWPTQEKINQQFGNLAEAIWYETNRVAFLVSVIP